MKPHKTLAIAAAFATIGGAALADSCTVDSGDPFALDAAATDALYACIEAKMAEGYAKEGDPIGSEFRNWTVTAIRPGVAGPHGERLLLTFANDIASEQYLKFAEEGVIMPAGSILAKESIKIRSADDVRVGPLFLMTKLDDGAAPETGDWLYGGIQPNGKEMKISQSFCHDCHSAYEAQDMLAYPLPELRVSN